MIQSRRRRLNVLQVATINKPISPAIGYGPIETVIRNIDHGLDSLGHRSIVACSSDSIVIGEKFETIPRSLGDYCRNHTFRGRALVDLHLSKVSERIMDGDIDVIHMHEWLESIYDGSFNPPVPVVMTLHVPAHLSGIKELRQRHPDWSARVPVQFAPISEHQRREYADFMTLSNTVPHGIDVRDYPYKEQPDHSGYLFSIGRIAKVKGQHTAIEVARRTGRKLIIAGCVQDKREDRSFFEELKASIDLIADVGERPVTGNYYSEVMKPLLSCGKQIIFIGELSTEAKKHWYRHARATLFPIQWGEPFGMVLVESMACGTPVLGFRAGAVPEILEDGETGFVVDSVASMVAAERLIDQLDRHECRRHVEENFSTRSMAEGYVELYDRLAEAPDSSKARSRDRVCIRKS